MSRADLRALFRHRGFQDLKEEIEIYAETLQNAIAIDVRDLDKDIEALRKVGGRYEGVREILVFLDALEEELNGPTPDEADDS